MLLEARDITKAFGSFKAVDAASVTLEQGDILGLIGPNGAGKSTFFNCLTGDLVSTSGKVLRLPGKGFTDKAGKRGDLKVTLAVDLPGDDAELRKFAEHWGGGGNPRGALGV